MQKSQKINPMEQKKQIMNMISQSFQANLNLLSFMEVNEDDWKKVLQSPQISKRDLNPPQEINDTKIEYLEKIKENLEGVKQSFKRDKEFLKICKDKEISENLEDVKNKIEEVCIKLERFNQEIEGFERRRDEAEGGVLIFEDVQKSIEGVDERVKDFEEKIRKLIGFEKNHLNGYYDNLVTKMRVKEQEIEVETKKIENSEINKLKSEIEGFKIVKTEHEKKTNEVASGYNKAMETKAMLNEEIRAKLVQRADDVAEMEEIEHFISKIYENLKNIQNFKSLHQTFERFETYRRSFYDNQRTSNNNLDTLNNTYITGMDGESTLAFNHDEFDEENFRFNCKEYENQVFSVKETIFFSFEEKDKEKLFQQYLDLQKRSRELDMVIHNNIIKVEKELLPEIRRVEQMSKALRQRQREIVNIGIDVAEEEDMLVQKLEMLRNENLEENKEIYEKIKILEIEKKNLEEDLGVIEGQKKQIEGRKKGLEEKRDRELKKKKLIGEWKGISNLIKLRDEGIQELEKLQIEKLSLENLVISRNYLDSDDKQSTIITKQLNKKSIIAKNEDQDQKLFARNSSHRPKIIERRSNNPRKRSVKSLATEQDFLNLGLRKKSSAHKRTRTAAVQDLVQTAREVGHERVQLFVNGEEHHLAQNGIANDNLANGKRVDTVWKENFENTANLTQSLKFSGLEHPQNPNNKGDLQSSETTGNDILQSFGNLHRRGNDKFAKFREFKKMKKLQDSVTNEDKRSESLGVKGMKSINEGMNESQMTDKRSNNSVFDKLRCANRVSFRTNHLNFFKKNKDQSSFIQTIEENGLSSASARKFPPDNIFKTKQKKERKDSDSKLGAKSLREKSVKSVKSRGSVHKNLKLHEILRLNLPLDNKSQRRKKKTTKKRKRKAKSKSKGSKYIPSGGKKKSYSLTREKRNESRESSSKKIAQSTHYHQGKNYLFSLSRNTLDQVPQQEINNSYTKLYERRKAYKTLLQPPGMQIMASSCLDGLDKTPIKLREGNPNLGRDYLMGYRRASSPQRMIGNTSKERISEVDRLWTGEIVKEETEKESEVTPRDRGEAVIESNEFKNWAMTHEKMRKRSKAKKKHSKRFIKEIEKLKNFGKVAGVDDPLIGKNNPRGYFSQKMGEVEDMEGDKKVMRRVKRLKGDMMIEKVGRIETSKEDFETREKVSKQRRSAKRSKKFKKLHSKYVEKQNLANENLRKSKNSVESTYDQVLRKVKSSQNSKPLYLKTPGSSKARENGVKKNFFILENHKSDTTFITQGLRNIKSSEISPILEEERLKTFSKKLSPRSLNKFKTLKKHLNNNLSSPESNNSLLKSKYFSSKILENKPLNNQRVTKGSTIRNSKGFFSSKSNDRTKSSPSGVFDFGKEHKNILSRTIKNQVYKKVRSGGPKKSKGYLSSKVQRMSRFVNFNPFNSMNISPVDCGYRVFALKYEKGLFWLEKLKKSKPKILKFSLKDVKKVLVSTSTTEFIKKRQECENLKDLNFFPLSLLVVKNGSKDRIDLIMTNLEDYNNFIRLRDSLKDFLRSNNWELQETEKSNVMTLVKDVSGTRVQVLFTSRSPAMEDGYEDEEQEEAPEEEEEMPQDYDFDLCEFTVYVEKNANQILAIEAMTMDGDLQVNSMNVIDDIATHRAMNPFSHTLNSYRGPEFGTLDETLQYATMDYIRSLGIDEEFASLIEHMSLDKEQRLYMGWLEDLEAFVR